MPLTLQLTDARKSRELQNVSGACSSTEEFVSQINTAIRQLMKRGVWFGTDVLVQMCVQGCQITLPRYVHSILGVRACGQQLDFKNKWYSIIGSHQSTFPWGTSGQMREVGMFPCYNEVSGNTGKQIAYHVVKAQDVGKKIVIYGFKYGNQPLQEQDENGNWRDGITITAISGGGSSIAKSTDLVTKITHVVREATQGMTYLYEFDPVTSLMRDLAVYEPNETNPMYRRVHAGQILSIPSWTDDYGRTLRRIEFLCQLQYVPMVNDWDFMLIDDLDALKYAVQAIKKDEAGEPEAAEAFWGKAVRELNMNDRSRNSGQSTVVKVRTMGSNRIISNPI